MNRFFFITAIAIMMASAALGQEDARFSLQVAVGKSYPVGQEEIIRHSSISNGNISPVIYGGIYHEDWDDAESGINFAVGAGINVWSKTWIRARFSSHSFKIGEVNYRKLDDIYSVYSVGLDILYYPDMRLAGIASYAFVGGGTSSRNDDMTDSPVYMTAGAGFEVPLRYRLTAVLEMSYLCDTGWEKSRDYLPVYLGIKSYFGHVRRY